MMSTEIKKTRDANIELLRILAMVGVVVLHIVNPLMGGGLKFATNFYSAFAMNFLKAIFVCAVNVYVLISGYFLSASNKRNLVKVLELLILTISLNGLVYIVSSNNFSFGGFLYSLIPNNWFVLLYVALYLISPFLNIIVEKLNKKQYLIMLGICLALFSVYPTIVGFIESVTHSSQLGTSTIGMYGSQSGYTIVNFVLMYLLGGFIKKFGINQFNTRNVSLLLLICFASILGLMYVDGGTAEAYCNPFVIFEAVTVFILFAKVNLKTIKPILWLSQASFMVYLTHIHLLCFVPITAFANKNFFIVIAATLAFALIMYLVGFIVNLIYSYTVKLLFNRLSRVEKLKLDYFK